MTSDIATKLRASRKDLLDIGLRNNLISFRKTAKNLALLDSDAGEVFDALYVGEKALAFVASDKPKRAAAAGAGRPAESDDEPASRELELLNELSHAQAQRAALDRAYEGATKGRMAANVRLHTGLDEERLFLQLLKIRAEAQGFIEEQGVNVLYLALGFLHWFESDTSQEARRAPLVMVPVRLVRASAQEPFKLEYTGDDLVLNLSLAAKLKADFSISLPDFDLDAEVGAPELQVYFKAVGEAVRLQKRWRVQADELVLGFFSFGKFLMFKDLDPQSWPEEKSPALHAVMGRLLRGSFGDSKPAFGDDVNVDSVCEPGDVHFVKDADSSQTQAILEVRAGSSLVIQGPPGTGKSQTITNLIAELISQGKTVLFVAEKMAALEVVKRRLDESHIGDAVLELHSQRATKKSVLDELQRSFDQGRPLTDQGLQDIANLKEVQQDLNHYCAVVSSTVGHSGLPFLEVLGRYMRCKREWPALVPLSFGPMAGWSEGIFLKRKDRMRELQVHLMEMGRPDHNPFWGSVKNFFTPVDENSAADTLQQSLQHVAQLQARSGELSQRLMLSQPVTVQDIDVVCRAARRAAQAPRLQGVQLSTQDWQLRRDVLRALIDAGQAMTALRQQFATVLIDVAWEQDLLQVRQVLLSHGSKWWRFLSSDFKQAKGRLQSLARSELPKAASEMLKMADGVMAYRQHEKVFLQQETLGQALFGAQWQGRQSDWAVLDRLMTWVVNLHDDLGKGTIPAGIVDFLAGHSDASGLGDVAHAIEALMADTKADLARVSDVLGIAQQPGAQDLQTTPLEQLAGQLEQWRVGLGSLRHMGRFNALAAQMSNEELTQFVTVAACCERPEQLGAALELTWTSGLLQSVYAENPTLQHFDRIQHEHRIARFRELDLASLQHAQTKLAAKVWTAKPNLNQPGEMSVLRTELNKKKRHLPIRQLILKAGRAIQQIKPVFMMSPMSIANFLPPGIVEFDVVIFDEASQVKAVDAFGAILRGKQVVVVGDTRQMPPTDFFGREVEIDDEDNTTGDIESILSMFKAAGCAERYLRWHYRSRHESLIAVSNAEFYDHKLVIFPSAGSDPMVTGISFEHLPEALYDRGRTRTNMGEAKAVARAVIAHALERPQLSLGVAAFSAAQRDLIDVEVELLRRRTPQAEPFFGQHPSEPFFVKNLENIQGDERDAIFISIGYGRNETGKIAREFGLLNKEGGHRRLNVLITRAKMIMRVFCNFKAEDMDLDASAKHGVRALKNFLKYAESGQLEVSYETGKAADSPFETEVIHALRDLNYEVEPQVGTAGYFIDMAVKDPNKPGRYLLAIECDGAAYHSSRSARDRDRLRQGVLEGLGWSFHRIWSTDWFRNRQQEISRVVAAIETAKERAECVAPVAAKPPVPTAHVIERGKAASEVEADFAQPYVRTSLQPVNGVELHVAPVHDLGHMVASVVAVEAPIHFSELTKRLMDAFNVVRAGTRITSRVREAIDHCVRRGSVTFRGDFVYGAGSDQIAPRDRSSFSPADKKIELVAPEEIDAALLESVRLGYSLDVESAISSAIRLLGFGRATQKIAATVEERLSLLVQSGALERTAGVITLSASPSALRVQSQAQTVPS
jgi:very-short-patch-repair endonuclease